MIFGELVDFCYRVLNSIMEFSEGVFNVLTYEVNIFGNTYSMFILMFGSGIYILLSLSFARFIVNIVTSD